MTTLDFKDAIAELVRQFPTASKKDKELAGRRLSGLMVVPDQTLLPRTSLSDEDEGEDEFYDNFPV